METHKLETVADLLASPEERVELIGGEIVRRPMAHGEHGMVQGSTREELSPFQREGGRGGWWIATEVSVAYEAHECPTHDLAGWRKGRMPERPRGVVELTPDWVCEIVSPGHERKDTLTLFLLLQRHRVPFYWLILPESRTLIAYQLDGEHYRVIATITEPARVHIPPFDAVAIDLGYILGDQGNADESVSRPGHPRQALGWRWHELPCRQDIDRPADLAGHPELLAAARGERVMP